MREREKKNKFSSKVVWTEFKFCMWVWWSPGQGKSSLGQYGAGGCWSRHGRECVSDRHWVSTSKSQHRRLWQSRSQPMTISQSLQLQTTVNKNRRRRNMFVLWCSGLSPRPPAHPRKVELCDRCRHLRQLGSLFHLSLVRNSLTTGDTKALAKLTPTLHRTHLGNLSQTHYSWRLGTHFWTWGWSFEDAVSQTTVLVSAQIPKFGSAWLLSHQDPRCFRKKHKRHSKSLSP